MTQVLISHDWTILREGMRTQLDGEPQVNVIETTDSGIAAMIGVRSGTVDVLVTGLDLRGLQGIEVLRRVRAEDGEHPVHVVVLLSAEQEGSLEEVLRLGADAVMVNQFSAEDLRYTVRSVALGRTVLIGSAASQLVDWFRSSVPVSPGESTELDALEALTAREHEILHLVAEGYSTDEVAQNLTIGVTTVRTHLHRLRGKLGVKDRAGLVSYAFRAGVVIPVSA
jgi:DNA-binding NarL/FixJ family response regulator